MEILLIWCVFCVVVGIAANARGRSGFGWFLLALVISPLIALVLVLVMRDLRREQRQEQQRASQNQRPPPLVTNSPPQARFGGKADRVTIDRAGPFEPDGVYAGIPYRVTNSGAIEAVMQGATVRFATMEKFMEVIGHPS